MSVVYRDSIQLDVPPEKIREFIMTPERILDYYPGGTEGGVIEPGAAIYCRSESGVSLLQVDQEASTAKTVVMNVYTAGPVEPPHTIESLREAAFFSMVEDWHLEPRGSGTLLTKTWRDITSYSEHDLPLQEMIVASAKSESEALRVGWNRAYKDQLRASIGKHSMKRFNDKVALVTGASSGIGAATAQRLASEGASVFAVGRSAEKLEETRRSIEQAGGSVTVHICDLTAPEACHNAVTACIESYGKLDILINCAGRHQFRALASITDEEWFSDIATNLGSAFFLSQAAMPLLLQTAGNIVNVGSLASVEGQAYSATYCSAKHGIAGLTRALAVEFANSPVRVNAICPGGTNTPQVAGMFNTLPEDADMDLIMRSAGLRGMGEPEAIAGVIAFLASSDAQAVHGAVYMADQGKTSG